MDDEERRRQPRPSGRGALGGLGIAAVWAALKLKTALAFLAGLKWLLVGSKLLLSFGSMFLSVWLYAVLFGGLKIAIVFVLMILVHELGHYLTWRNFGVRASLPMFVPGLGAFVAGAGGTPAQNVGAAIAGPIFGLGAAAVCWGFGIAQHERFWIAAAYIGFFLNFFNLLPIPMLDGGTIARAVDARLWYLGIPAIAYYAYRSHSMFSILLLLIIAFYALPQLLALWRGRLDPRPPGLTAAQRLAAGLGYLATALLAAAGAYATAHAPSALQVGVR